MTRSRSEDVLQRELCATRVSEALRCIEGRWKMPILAHLCANVAMRYSDLERAIPQASQKMLTQHLRELEGDGIITRTIYPEVPPRVEYRLTGLGNGLRPVFLALADWADIRERTTAPSTGELTRSCDALSGTRELPTS